MKPILTILFVFLLTTSVVHAVISLDITEQKNTILPYEAAEYVLSFTNSGSQDEVVTVKTDSNRWLTSPTTFDVSANGTTEQLLYISHRMGVGLNNYRVPLSFSTNAGVFKDTDVFLSISYDLFTQGYPVNVKAGIGVPASVDPRNDFLLQVNLTNNNLRDIEEIVISVTSDVFTDTFTTSLQPLSVVHKTRKYVLDDLLVPAQHPITVVVTESAKDENIAYYEGFFKIAGYADIKSERGVIDNVLLKKTERIRLSNAGNDARTKNLKYELAWLERLFSSASPEAVVVPTDLGKAYSWDVSIAAGQTQDILVTTNYRPLAIGIIIIILLIIAYFVFRSPIVLYKEMRSASHSVEGSSELKVRIYVKNRSGKPVDDIKIIDRVPRIAEMIKHAHLGTLQPSKITKSEKRGTIIRWEVETLEPYEERIISYKIRSKLKIVGGMNLPVVKAKFNAGGRKERVTLSGPTKVA